MVLSWHETCKVKVWRFCSNFFPLQYSQLPWARNFASTQVEALIFHKTHARRLCASLVSLKIIMIFSYIINRPPSINGNYMKVQTWLFHIFCINFFGRLIETSAQPNLYCTPQFCSFVFQDRKFLITCGLDGFVVKTLTSGVCPPSSVLELLAEVKYFARSV